MKNKIYRKRDDLKDALFEALGTSPKTVYSIAKSVGMARSTHLQNVLIEMVNEGTVCLDFQEHRAGVFKRVFYIHPDLAS